MRRKNQKPSSRGSLGLGTKLRITPGCEDLLQELGLGDPRRAADFQRGEVVVDSGSSRVLRFEDPRPEGGQLFFKVYRYYHLRPMFTFTYRSSRARTEYESLCHLREHGVPVPMPIAFGSHRVARVIRSCFLLTKGIEGAQDLDRFLPGFFGQERDAAWRAQRRRGLDELAELVRRMHATGFFDHDLYFRNILIRSGENPEFWFIDHPKGSIIRRPGGARWRRARTFDFACLDRSAREWFSRSERLRFLLRATATSRLDEDARVLVGDVDRVVARQLRKRDRKLARRARRGPRRRRSW